MAFKGNIAPASEMPQSFCTVRTQMPECLWQVWAHEPVRTSPWDCQRRSWSGRWRSCVNWWGPGHQWELVIGHPAPPSRHSLGSLEPVVPISLYGESCFIDAELAFLPFLSWRNSFVCHRFHWRQSLFINQKDTCGCLRKQSQVPWESQGGPPGVPLLQDSYLGSVRNDHLTSQYFWDICWRDQYTQGRHGSYYGNSQLETTFTLLCWPTFHSTYSVFLRAQGTFLMMELRLFFSNGP